jgi:hypothetical protein
LCPSAHAKAKALQISLLAQKSESIAYRQEWKNAAHHVIQRRLVQQFKKILEV